MLFNNLKIAFRVFSRDRVFTFINILGLSTGLAIALLILLFVKSELSYESYNPKSDQLVRITMDYLNGETLIDQDAETYPPLGPRIKREFPEVTEFTRAQSIDERTVKIGDRYYFVKRALATDPSFFSLLNYPLLDGEEADIFKAPYEIVLTESLAKICFGNTDVVGKSLLMSEVETPFQVVGLIKDSPANTHLKFNMLISYPTLKAAMREDDQTWNSNNGFTYLHVNPGVTEELLNQKLADLSLQLHKEEKIEGERVIAQFISDIHLYSHKSYEPEANGNASSVFILLGVAILVIVIAIVNYINLATSRSLERAKEVGIRKVIGSSLFQLRFQFMAESLLMNVVAAIGALMIMAVALPYFRDLAGLPLSFTIFNDPFFWGLLGGILLLSTLLSGIFPAFILSSFKPASVLKGKFATSTFGIRLRKGLVVFQFAITTFLLIQTLAVTEQLHFMQTMDLGVDLAHTIVVESPDTEEYKQNFKRFKDQLNQHSQVESVSLSTCVPGLPTSQMSSTTGINLVNAIDPHYYNFYIYFIDQDFIPTLGVELLAGENYKRKLIMILR